MYNIQLMLPNETLTKIFQLLPPKDQAHLAMACKQTWTIYLETIKYKDIEDPRPIIKQIREVRGRIKTLDNRISRCQNLPNGESVYFYGGMLCATAGAILFCIGGSTMTPCACCMFTDKAIKILCITGSVSCCGGSATTCCVLCKSQHNCNCCTGEMIHERTSLLRKRRNEEIDRLDEIGMGLAPQRLSMNADTIDIDPTDPRFVQQGF